MCEFGRGVTNWCLECDIPAVQGWLFAQNFLTLEVELKVWDLPHVNKTVVGSKQGHATYDIFYNE